jgi:large subunit ribosomal protein L12
LKRRTGEIGMEYIYAAMLLHKASKPIDEDNVTKILKTAGIKVEPSRVKALVAALADINIDEAIKSAANYQPSTPPVTQTGPEATKTKEKPKEEKKEAEAVEGLGALFG